MQFRRVIDNPEGICILHNDPGIAQNLEITEQKSELTITNLTPHGPNCQSEGPRPIPVDFGCSRFTFERSIGFKKFGWAVFEKIDFLKI